MRHTITWIDLIFERSPRVSGGLKSALIGLSSAVCVSAPLILGKQLSLTIARDVALFALGVGWVCGSCRMITYDYARPLFRLEEIIIEEQKPVYLTYLRTSLTSMNSMIGVLIPTLILWFLCLTLYVQVLYFSWAISDAQLPHILPAAWYRQEGAEWRVLSVGIMLLIGWSIVYTTGRLLMIHAVFVFRLVRLTFMPSVQACQYRLRPVLRVGIAGAFCWSLGVLLVALLFEFSIGSFGMLIIGALSLVGALGFMMPVFAIRRKIAEVRDGIVENLHHRLIARLSIKSDSTVLRDEISQIEQRINSIYAEGNVMTELKYIGIFAANILIPVIGAVATEMIVK